MIRIIKGLSRPSKESPEDEIRGHINYLAERQARSPCYALFRGSWRAVSVSAFSEHRLATAEGSPVLDSKFPAGRVCFSPLRIAFLMQSSVPPSIFK